MSSTQSDLTLNHVGFILDGNRRWAKERGLPTMKGHMQGYDNLKEIVRHAQRRGLKFVSAYIFSTENWKRSKDEVSYLMDLALKMVTRDLGELNKENIRVRFLGERTGISDKLAKAIEKAEEQTSQNTGGTFAVCFNYGGIQEITQAAQKAAATGEPITEELLAQNLYAPEVPPVDLMIRTSGEQRISNFMLWRLAYSEFLFINKYWPDFTNDDFDDAIEDYEKRHRRFGE